MATVGQQIDDADKFICRTIEELSDQRDYASQVILSSLRTLVEASIVLLHQNSLDIQFDTRVVLQPALNYVSSQDKINFVVRFHAFLQSSASHYIMNGDSSERLMLKYYEYLFRLRSLLKTKLNISILDNLELFPMNADPSLQEYYEKIAHQIESRKSWGEKGENKRYYIHKIVPFYVRGEVYYEVTFYLAINKVDKFSRIIGFTKLDISDKYSVNLIMYHDSITVFGQTMPITIITNWEVSIRPCEFKNFALLFGMEVDIRVDNQEYRKLMQWLTKNFTNLIDLMDKPEDAYNSIKQFCTAENNNPIIFPILDKARKINSSGKAGSNIIRYLLLRMRNRIIKSQYSKDTCHNLSDLNLDYGCIPFDSMPFCAFPKKHVTRVVDLFESLEPKDRKHEFLARKVLKNNEVDGRLYTPMSELETYGNVAELIEIHNKNLYTSDKQQKRKLIIDKKHVFISGYEDDTLAIIHLIKDKSCEGVDDHTQNVEDWLHKTSLEIEDPLKLDALKRLFSKSTVALIYGAAGTGKTTMVDYISQYFNDENKLFLAHTNPAKDNLERKITAQNSTFKTIKSHTESKYYKNYDLLVIDECSTVSNSDLLKVLQMTSFKYLVLVGDVYQIESINFGNWFTIIRSFLPEDSVFEFTTPYRTENKNLINFWDNVRNNSDDLTELITQYGYSGVLDEKLFEKDHDDEIVLCYNYDGLYGINNINRFLQGSNRNPPFEWQSTLYKVGDPVLFNKTERFRPVLYNNLKGVIENIHLGTGEIIFDVKLENAKSIYLSSIPDLEWIDDFTVRFSVFDQSKSANGENNNRNDISDEDDDSENTIVPFQIAYAVSIHKAQGLEYNSVKIVITDANDEDITHNIFYTAVTRTREHLRIFWTPETQQKILKNLSTKIESKDVSLLCVRNEIQTINKGNFK